MTGSGWHAVSRPNPSSAANAQRKKPGSAHPPSFAGRSIRSASSAFRWFGRCGLLGRLSLGGFADRMKAHARRGRRFGFAHKLADGVEDDPELRVLFLLHRFELACQFRV